MRKRLNRSLLAVCLLAICYVGMGAEGCRTQCLESQGCGANRDACEDSARATYPPGAALKAAIAQCRTNYDECVSFCKSFPQDPGSEVPE